MRSSLFQSCRSDEENVCIPEEGVKNDDKGKETEEDESVWDEDDVEPGSVLSVECPLNPVAKQLLPDGLLVKLFTFFSG